MRAALGTQARAEGFVAVGIASAAPDAPRGERLAEWLGDERHGSMEWMARRVAERASPQGLWPEAKSVIALGMSYAPEHDPLALADVPDRARISVYAQGRDYHDTVKKLRTFSLKTVSFWVNLSRLEVSRLSCKSLVRRSNSSRSLLWFSPCWLERSWKERNWGWGIGMRTRQKWVAITQHTPNTILKSYTKHTIHTQTHLLHIVPPGILPNQHETEYGATDPPHPPLLTPN
ncbi:DUF1730 domain-containing protein [archaeon]|nr:MAG: DUF1730 domain-containing protein [archaeon]